MWFGWDFLRPICVDNSFLVFLKPPQGFRIVIALDLACSRICSSAIRSLSDAVGTFVLVGSLFFFCSISMLRSTDVCFVGFSLDTVGALRAEWRSAECVVSLS